MEAVGKVIKEDGERAVFLFEARCPIV